MTCRDLARPCLGSSSAAVLTQGELTVALTRMQRFLPSPVCGRGSMWAVTVARRARAVTQSPARGEGCEAAAAAAVFDLLLITMDSDEEDC